MKAENLAEKFDVGKDIVSEPGFRRTRRPHQKQRGANDGPEYALTQIPLLVRLSGPNERQVALALRGGP